ncbi:MAG: hypothetical protein M0Q44_00610 [Methylobacter sp.]|jgi:Cu(I)/Ag(I) efflux system membrane protein CusA/SilA|nr:hypothetical protein [Methylobacter sp.]
MKLKKLKQASLTEIRTAAENATVLLTNIVGLILIMWAIGMSADFTQRIAAPALGGMLTVLILTLLVFPVIYSLVLLFQEECASEEVLHNRCY